jgi:AcrR family transcriptional regulator
LKNRVRLTREDWAIAALRAIARGGLKAVAVEPLAKHLGVTKGSFYWHFKNRDELLQAALLRWEFLGDEAIAVTTRSTSDPRKRLQMLFEAAFDPKNAHALLHHLSTAKASPIVGPVLQRVTTKRLQALTEMYIECGLDESTAKHRSLLAYATYVGMFQIRATAPDATPVKAHLLPFTEHITHTLIP